MGSYLLYQIRAEAAVLFYHHKWYEKQEFSTKSAQEVVEMENIRKQFPEN